VSNDADRDPQPSGTQLPPPSQQGSTAAPEGSLGWTSRLGSFRHRHKKWEEVLFFVGGFCFDLLLLERVDSFPMLIHQGSYLLLLSFLVAVDHRFSVKGEPASVFWRKVFRFRTEVIHFLFGTLLTAFLVFYFKAASGLFSFAFLVVLGAILLANEAPRFRRLGPVMRVALLGFAVASYFSYLFPVMAGFLSPYLYVLAVLSSTAAMFGLWRIYRWWTKDPGWTLQRAVLPSLSIHAALILLYLIHVLPPVPLSLKWIGIYHGAERQGEMVKVSHQRPAWKLWHHGDQSFLARAGDRIFCFTRIFAPRHFRDGLKVRWAYQSPSGGWTGTDAIPLTISGGQEHGWRGIAYKRNFIPGRWKVNIETDDGREVGSIHFTVEDDLSTEPRSFVDELR